MSTLDKASDSLTELAAEESGDALHPVTRAIHWFTVLAIIAVFVSVLIGADLEDPEQKKLIVGFHQSLGLSVLLLNGLRLLWRWWHPMPSLITDPVKRMIGHLSHATVYSLLMAQPLLGWLYVSARGRTANFWGLPMPALLDKNRELADSIHAWHENTGWLLLALIAAHALAALHHHYVLKDGVLRRMVSGR
ncbi:cytochrome b/b6 domain-containing protein [Nevskia sp.]|uniref:cytochrome b n=1 Tax=Nevskia sp. TaxID=1929292 RepID=UPI0025ED9DF3|nr:cytochrome b/b6 domain-containing protein [Nevskia sp.]